MNNIQDIFVPYELSKALMELDFNEECIYCYYPYDYTDKQNYGKFFLKQSKQYQHNQTMDIDTLISKGFYKLAIKAPTWEQSFSFMENKRIYKNITYDWNEESYRVCSYHLKKRKKVKKNIFKNHKKNKNLLFNSKYNPLNYNLNEICKEN